MKMWLQKARKINPYRKRYINQDTQEEVAYSDTPDGTECIEIHSVHWNKSVEQRVNVYFKTILKRIVANGYNH